MQQVTQSPLLQALGYAILNSLWQFALLWLVYVLLNTLWKFSSHYKYTSGLVLQIAGFTWFIFTLVFYYNQCSALASTSYLQQQFTLDLSSADNAATLKEKILRWVLQTEQVLPYLSLAYLTLLLFFITKWLQAYKFTQAVRSRGLQAIDPQWTLFVQQLSLQLGITRTVAIHLSEVIKTPLTIGFFKPLILIPLASINHLSTEQMEAVIIHELAHIKRFDYLLNLFLVVIEAAMFFNPFMQLISIQIKRERENCCDDWVLQFEYNATSYARALLQIAINQRSLTTLALNATDNKQALLNRIKRMIERKEKTFFNYRHQLLALLVITTVLGTLALFSKKNNIFSVNTKGEVSPTLAKAENPLFNPVYFFLDEDVETTAPAEPEKVIVEEKKALFPDPTNTPVAQENLVTEVQPLKTRVLPRVSSIAPVGNSFARGEDSKKTIIQDLNEAPENDMRWENKNLENDIHSQVFNSALPSEGNTLVVNRAKVLEDLETVLLELNNVKLQKEMDKLYRENFDEVAKAGSKNKRDAEVEIFRSKQEEWKTIANQIRSQIEKAKTNVSKLSNSKTGQNVTFSFTVPDVNNKPAAEKASHYSFEYSVEPGIKLIAPKILPKVNQQTSRRKLTELSGEVQQQKTIEYLSIPAKPAPPVKRIHIIRI